MKSLSIVIPAYNEANRIGNLLQSIFVIFPAAEVIVVDDGSTDGTAETVREILPRAKMLRNKTNRGKGYSVRRGILEAGGDYVCFTDADGAVPVTELCALLRHLAAGCDVAIGSRRTPGARVKMPLHRRVTEVVFNRLVKWATGLPYRDTQCGFKAFTRAAAREIFSRLQDTGFGFDVEALILARALGYAVAEVPVTWRHVPGSKVRLFRDGWKMLKFVWSLRERKTVPVPGVTQ